MIFWIFFLLLILLGIWFCIEQHVLRVRKQTLSLEHLPAGWDGVSLLQITDLHHRQMGRGNCRIIRQAQQLQPDVIVLTGDMISRDMRDFHEISSFLQALSKISPTYLCTGNHELDLPPEVQQEFWAMAEQAGCHPLRNETVPLEKSGCPPLYLAGAELAYGIYRDDNRGFRHLQPYTADDLTQALGIRQGCTVLLAHNPLLLDSYAGWGADVVLSGHVHGGMVRLPFVGGVLSPERRFFRNMTRGCTRKAAQSCMYPAASASRGCSTRRRST